MGYRAALKSGIKDFDPTLWVFMILMVVCFVWAVKVFWPQDRGEVTIRLGHDPACDLRAGPCESRLPAGAKISLAIEPRSIPLLKTLQFTVNVTADTVDKVLIDINGVDMNMGFNQVKLKSMGNGVFQGKGDLSVCIHDVMEWEAKVLLYQSEKITEVPFRFITVKGNTVNRLQ